MKMIKKYTAMMLSSRTHGNDVNGHFYYGYISGPYYDEKHPPEIFDSEDEAIEYISKHVDKENNWVILPVISFEVSK